MPGRLVVEMFKAIPTMRVVKDEAGNPLKRITEIRQKTSDKLSVFAGNGVRVMIDELRLGFSGYCPVVSLSDVYEQAFELYVSRASRARPSICSDASWPSILSPMPVST